MSNAEVLKQYIDSGFTLELEVLPSDELNPKWVSIYAINGMQAKLGSLHYLVKSGVKLRVAKEKRRVRICEMKNNDILDPKIYLYLVYANEYTAMENHPRFLRWVTEEMEVE